MPRTWTAVSTPHLRRVFLGLRSRSEVLRGETLDEEQLILADVFALGLVLWFMCTGARPLQHLDNDGMHKPASHVMKAFKDGRMPRPRLADARLSAFFRSLLLRMSRRALECENSSVRLAVGG